MTGLRPLWRLWCIAFYSWAQREIDPLHPDVGHVLERLSYWREAK